MSTLPSSLPSAAPTVPPRRQPAQGSASACPGAVECRASCHLVSHCCCTAGRVRWPGWRAGRAANSRRWGAAREGRRSLPWSVQQGTSLTAREGAAAATARKACISWLERARSDVEGALAGPLEPGAAVRSYALLQSLLKHLQAAGEPEVRVWVEQLGSLRRLQELEAQIRSRAEAVFESAKFELARGPDRNAMRADLLRPCFADVPCDRVWAEFRKEESCSRAALLAGLAGCTEEDAAALLRFGLRLSELFAPVELASRVARQEWSGARPFALGAALLPLLEAAIHTASASRREQQRPISVAVLGGYGLAAALASRLGCEVVLAEPRQLARSALQLLLRSNGLEKVAVVEEAPVNADIVVLEGVDDDTIFELGVLSRLRVLLRRRRMLGLAPPLLVPERLRIHAAPVDYSLPRVRGCDLSRFDRLRGSELSIPHRWPRGACHLQPRLRAAPQCVWELQLSQLAADAVQSSSSSNNKNNDNNNNNNNNNSNNNNSSSSSPLHGEESKELSFQAEPDAPVSGMAFWIDAPLGPTQEAEGGLPGLPSEAWLACVQPLPPRRAATALGAGPGLPLKMLATLTDLRIWFRWPPEADSDGADGRPEDTQNAALPLLPPFGKSKLPAWHFKMLNDHERNRRYELALARAIQAAAARARQAGQAKRPSVVDCGCGADLLSLMAARAGAGEVCSLELSPVIADITTETVKAYLAECGMRNEGLAAAALPPLPAMGLCTADVRSLSAEQVGRHDVIVCELMDASGVGESLLGVLEHACSNFAAPGAQVIPSQLSLTGALGWLGLPSCHGGFDFSPLDALYFCSRSGGPFGEAARAKTPPPRLFAGPGAGGQGSDSPPSLHCSGPFASKNLNRLVRGEAWDLMSPEVPFLRMDLQSALHGQRLHPREAEVEVTASRAGVVNCILWWWNAQLDAQEALSNRPLALGGDYATHWHQPMVPMGPIPVQKGDRFRLKVSIGDAVGQKLAYTLEPAEPGSASAWVQSPSATRLSPEPLVELMQQWRKDMDEACAENTALTSKFTSRGDLAGLASLQRAVLALVGFPALFGCDPHIRDRLLQSYFGVGYK